MIHTIVFSFDRAIQLELLLNSIAVYDSKKKLRVSVLYSFSAPAFENAYTILIARFPGINWIQEQRFPAKFMAPILPFYWHNYFWWAKYKHNRIVNSHFRAQLIEAVETNEDDCVMFLTDDSLFFSSIDIPETAIGELKQLPHARSFSLRHGLNLAGGNHGYLHNLISWNVYDQHDHPEWSYPFSVDGHIYSKSFIVKSFKKIFFKNPNTLEGNMACYVKEKKLLPDVYANLQSCLVGFELNRVQTVSNNNNLNISSDYLNALFTKGYRMQIDFKKDANKLFRPSQFKVDVRRDEESINIITL